LCHKHNTGDNHHVMPANPVARVLDALGIDQARVTVLKDVPSENASWLVERPGRDQLVLRRYHRLATTQDLAYEHQVLRHLAAAGWAVPVPVSGLAQCDGLWYCPDQVRARPAGRRGERG
jgi:homoserine kinase type II